MAPSRRRPTPARGAGRPGHGRARLPASAERRPAVSAAPSPAQALLADLHARRLVRASVLLLARRAQRSPGAASRLRAAPRRASSLRGARRAVAHLRRRGLDPALRHRPRPVRHRASSPRRSRAPPAPPSAADRAARALPHLHPAHSVLRDRVRLAVPPGAPTPAPASTSRATIRTWMLINRLTTAAAGPGLARTSCASCGRPATRCSRSRGRRVRARPLRRWTAAVPNRLAGEIVDVAERSRRRSWSGLLRSTRPLLRRRRPGRFRATWPRSAGSSCCATATRARWSGFSTQRTMDVVVGGRPVRALFSGDTVIDPALLGRAGAGARFCRLIGAPARRVPERPAALLVPHLQGPPDVSLPAHVLPRVLAAPRPRRRRPSRPS